MKEQFENCTLYLGDCRDIIPDLPQVDAVITDPPYYSTDLHFDKEERIDFKQWLVDCKQAMKFDGNLVSFADFDLLAELRSYHVFTSRYELIWQKNLAVGFLNCKKMPLRSHEYIGVFRNKQGTYNPQMFNHQNSRYKLGEGNNFHKLNITAKMYDYKANRRQYIEVGKRHPLSVIFCQNWNGGMALDVKAGNIKHPTQKPLELLNWLTLTYSNPNDTILDPFMGSGTTGVSCAKLNRQFIGIEKHVPYFDMACRRIENECKQNKLFA